MAPFLILNFKYGVFFHSKVLIFIQYTVSLLALYSLLR